MLNTQERGVMAATKERTHCRSLHLVIGSGRIHQP